MVKQFSKKDIQDVIDAAQRLNVELDETEAVEWLEAIQKAKESDDDIAFCERTGVFGQNVVMLDFSPERLDYFRKIGNLVEFYDEPGRVETALALSGSSAQSKIQRFPGDADYFEREHHRANKGSGLPDLGGDHAREGALNGAGTDLPVDRGENGLLPGGFCQG